MSCDVLASLVQKGNTGNNWKGLSMNGAELKIISLCSSTSKLSMKDCG